MSNGPFFLIAFTDLSEERSEVVQALITEKCNGWWWHNFPRLWIVGGESARYWRDLLRPVLAGTQSEVLVMKLAEADFEWAAKGPGPRFNWLHEAFGTKTPPPADASA